MIEDREFGVTDHPPKLRQRLKAILILAVSAAWAGYLISYTFPAKYTSQSLILVETETVPPGEAQPVAPEDRANTLRPSSTRC